MKFFLILYFIFSLQASGLVLHKGWNLAGSSFGNINISKIIPNIGISWVVKKNRWYEYSYSTLYKNTLRYKFNGTVKSGEGFWIYTNNNLSGTIAYDSFLDTTVFVKKGWNLVSIKSDYQVDISNYFSDDIKIAWVFRDNHWSVFSPSKKTIDKIQTEEILLFQIIHPFNGFLIFSYKNQLFFDKITEKIEVLPADTKIKLNKSLNVLGLNSSDILKIYDAEKSLFMPLLDKNISKKPVFIDGVFRGIIKSVDIDKNTMKLTIDDAIDVDRIYNSNTIQKSFSKAISLNPNLALYDSINESNLKKYFVNNKLQGLEISYRQNGTKEKEFNYDSICALSWKKIYTANECFEKMTSYKEVTSDVYGTTYTLCEVDNIQNYKCLN